MKSPRNLLLLVSGLALVDWCSAFAQQSPPAQAAPPPAAPVKRSATDLEKLVAPIALYPDPLLATILPASVYPLEVVQAARFVADTNNLAKLDAQPWDDSVKAVARIPAAIQKLNEDISWTIELGEAFLAQDKDVMDAIQNMRAKAQKAGTLQTTPQQIVTVTNMIVEKTVEQQVVVVTNTVVQIAPASSSVVYVPTYNPYTVYYPPPAYVYNPYAPLVTFGVGVAMGAIIANNCNWYHGGCYHGNVNINVNNNYNRNNNFNQNNNINRNNQGGQQKWQPDQNRLNKSGSASASTRSAEARGYGSGGAKPSTGSVGARPSTGTTAARPSTGTTATRPSTANAGARPTSTWQQPSATRATPSPSASQSRSSSAASRPSSSGSAFSGTSSGASARSASSRGSSSRSSGGFSGGGGGRGGGGRR
jgi:hypothetical protein